MAGHRVLQPRSSLREALGGWRRRRSSSAAPACGAETAAPPGRAATPDAGGSGSSAASPSSELAATPKALAAQDGGNSVASSSSGGRGDELRCRGTRRAPEDTRDLFRAAPGDVPPIGGLVELRAEHSEHLLPAEVLLYEPAADDIFHRGCSTKRGSRQLFLNAPLSSAESEALGDLRQALVKRGVIARATDPLPRYMEAHALRMLQTCKYDVAKTMRLMQTNLTERVLRLPISEEEVLSDLKSGFMYWHGRDRRCRPCLVVRIDRMGNLAFDRERATRLVLFTLEYALRFAMVPGRVENWVVVIDVQNAMSLVNPFTIGIVTATACVLGSALEKAYAGRMGWIKIVNLGGGSMLSSIINSSIPAEKRNKVSFPVDLAAEMAEHFEPHQLEQRYGGTAPNLAPGETYPFCFFPNATGPASKIAALSESDDGMLTACSTVASTCDGCDAAGVDCPSLRGVAGLDFHEGRLWDESCGEARERWLQAAVSSSLTTEAAAVASLRLGARVLPCQNAADWLSIVSPAVVDVGRTKRAPSSSSASAADDDDDGIPQRDAAIDDDASGDEPRVREVRAFPACHLFTGRLQV